jgi:hypothetical protein
MTPIELKKSDFENELCSFTLKDGRVFFGVIANFFNDEPDNYYLVLMSKFPDFLSFKKDNKTDKMKEIAQLVDVNDIVKAKKLDDFGEMLATKALEAEEDKNNWDIRKAIWLKSIDDFYSNINLWFDEYKNEGLLKIEDKEINLDEQFIGRYTTKLLEIYLGNDIITFTPRGTLVFGGYGRIDLKGPKGDALLIEQEWNKWKFAKRTPALKYIDVNEESLKKVIQEIING